MHRSTSALFPHVGAFCCPVSIGVGYPRDNSSRGPSCPVQPNQSQEFTDATICGRTTLTETTRSWWWWSSSRRNINYDIWATVLINGTAPPNNWTKKTKKWINLTNVILAISLYRMPHCHVPTCSSFNFTDLLFLPHHLPSKPQSKHSCSFTVAQISKTRYNSI